MTNSPLKNVIEWAIQFVYQIRWVDTRAKYFIKGPVNYNAVMGVQTSWFIFLKLHYMYS